jgi:hypothetical protein
MASSEHLSTSEAFRPVPLPLRRLATPSERTREPSFLNKCRCSDAYAPRDRFRANKLALDGSLPERAPWFDLGMPQEKLDVPGRDSRLDRFEPIPQAASARLVTPGELLMASVQSFPVALRLPSAAFTLLAALPDEVLSVKMPFTFAPARAARAWPAASAARLIEPLSFTLGAECEPVDESAEIFFRGFGVMRLFPRCVRQQG